ncbi:MAG TPA: right-handed parallel beta-helix repeat-containing protein [Lysobacter sp.]
MNRSNAALALFTLAACTAAHAETSNCTNLAALPAVISTQGVYCLKQDLSTSISSGAAISVNASNVTLDCNGYKLGGLGAGIGTAASGIVSQNRLNLTVRNCNIRGFRYGMRLAGTGGGHLVEDNRFDGNTFTGMYVSGDGSMIRGNSVFSTGGSTYTGELISWTTGIEAVAAAMSSTTPSGA